MRWTLMIGLLLAACGPERVRTTPTVPSGPSGSPDRPLAIVPGQVRLAVGAAVEASDLGTSPIVDPSMMFVLVQVTVLNGLTTAITVAPPTFRLRTEDGLELLASPESTRLPAACPSDAFLAGGEQLPCILVFEVAITSTPRALVYVGASDGGQAEPIRAESPITDFVRCDRCRGQCTDLSIDPRHCGSCDSAVPAGGECVEGSPRCPSGETQCGSVCADLTSSYQNCGECGREVGEGFCLEGTPTCYDSDTWEAGRCYDFAYDDNNCGGHGIVCTWPRSCTQGVCLETVYSQDRISCAEVCGDQGMACLRLDDLPEFDYTCPNSASLWLIDAPCTQVPPATATDPVTRAVCSFSRINCLCL